MIGNGSQARGLGLIPPLVSLVSVACSLFRLNIKNYIDKININTGERARSNHGIQMAKFGIQWETQLS